MKWTACATGGTLTETVARRAAEGRFLYALRRQDAAALARLTGAPVTPLAELFHDAGLRPAADLDRAADRFSAEEPGAYLKERGLHDPLVVFPSSVAARVRRPAVLVLPAGIPSRPPAGWGEAFDEAIRLRFEPRSPAPQVLHACYGIFDQARHALRLRPDAVVFATVGNSALALLEEGKELSYPPTRFAFYLDRLRRALGGLPCGPDREIDFLRTLAEEPVFDWEPDAEATLLCGVDDAPVVPLGRVALIGMAETESGECERETRHAHALSTELHLFRYAYAGGKPRTASRAYELRRLETGGDEETLEAPDEAAAPPAPPAAVSTSAAAAAPLPAADEPPAAQRTLSNSVLMAYLACPRRFFLSRVLGLEEPPSPPRLVGLAVHAILEAHHSAGAPADPETFVEEFVRGEAGERITPVELRLITREVLELYAAYLESGVGELGETLATEKKWRFDLEGLPFTARIDRLVRVDGGFLLVDYKTGGKKKEVAHKRQMTREPELGKDNCDWQVPLYVTGAEAAGFSPVVAFCFIYVRSGERPEAVTLHVPEIRAEIRKGLDNALTVARMLRRDARFEPPPRPPCRTGECFFRVACGG